MTTKNVVITGASVGIGAAIAHRFAKEKNYRLILLARRLDKLNELKSELDAKNVVTYALDVTSRANVEARFAQIENDFGPIDILVNNAGGAFGLDPAHEANLDDWETCIAVNINGVIYCTRSVLPSMVKHNRGHIFFLGSIAASYSYIGGNVYGGTKAFIQRFALNLRSDLLGTGVRVTCIEPGLVGETEFSLVRFKGDGNRAKNVYENTQPLLPEDIAEIIFFTATVPSHVNINTLEVMPINQAPAGLAIHRE